MWVVLGCVLYLSKDAKGCYCLKKVRNPKTKTHAAMWVVLGSVLYLSNEAKDVGCFVFGAVPFKGGDGLLLFG